MASSMDQDEAGDVFHSPMQERRIILIGKTGNGKSSLGNLILGKKQFPVGFSMTSTTVISAYGSVDFQGGILKVLDTPDIFNNPEMAENEQAQRQVSSWLSLTSPGAHAILLAVRCDVRYTREEHDIYLKLKRLWGGKPLTRRLIVAFTFGDRQDRDLGQDLRVVCQELKNVLQDAGNRYLLFNDSATPENKQQQVLDLLQLMDRLNAEVLTEERRMLLQPQVCPTFCLPTSSQFQRSSSGGSSDTGGSITDQDYIRLILLGKPRSGKSSTGNTILGRAVFPVHNRGTERLHFSSKEEVVIDNKHVQVVDTPGILVQASGPGTQDNEDYQRERRMTFKLVKPGPHALLYVVRHRDVTQEDLDGFRAVKQILGPGLSHHTIIVLVGVHGQRKTPSSSSIQYVKDGRPSSRSDEAESPPSPSSPTRSRTPSMSTALEEAQVLEEEGEVFSALLQEAGNKLWAVDNISAKLDSRQQQVAVLMGLINGILSSSGGDYFCVDQAAHETGKRRGAGLFCFIL